MEIEESVKPYRFLFQPTDRVFIKRCLYYYELIKRPGWCNRHVESVRYTGDFGYRHDISLDISFEELSNHLVVSENESWYKPLYYAIDTDDNEFIIDYSQGERISPGLFIDREQDISSSEVSSKIPDEPLKILPVGALDKQISHYDFNTKNASGRLLQILPRYKSNGIVECILFGSLLKYAIEQLRYYDDRENFENLDLHEQARISAVENGIYRELYPTVLPVLPSTRMMAYIMSYCESDLHYIDIDGLFDDIDDTFAHFHNESGREGLNEIEEMAWEWMKGIYEFRELVYYYTRNWLVILELDGFNDENGNYIVKFQYTEILNVFDSDDNFFDRMTIERIIRITFSMVIALAFGIYIFYNTIHIISLIIISLAILLLAYLSLSREFLHGFFMIFGIKALIPFKIGLAETEHFTFFAPEGLVFSPLDSTENIQIFERAKWYSRNKEAIVQAAIGSEHITIRSNQQWNNLDPWGDYSKGTTGNRGHRYRRFAYVKEEKREYFIKAKLRPKSAKRGFAYSIAPLITLTVFLILQNILNSTIDNEYQNVENVIRLFLSFIPLVTYIITLNEDEPFVRRVVFYLPRACWEMSIIIAIAGLIIYNVPILAQLYWTRLFNVSIITLTILSIITIVWFIYNKLCDSWNQKPGVLKISDVELRNID